MTNRSTAKTLAMTICWIDDAYNGGAGLYVIVRVSPSVHTDAA